MTLSLRKTVGVVMGLAVMAATATVAAGAVSEESTALQVRLAALGGSSNPVVDGAPITSLPVLVALYERREYRPAWESRTRVEALLRLVRSSVDDGLNPVDFHAPLIAARLHSKRNDPAFRADSEILYSDALARLGVTLHFGKLDPETFDRTWNFARHFDLGDPVEVMAHVLESADLEETVERLAPQSPFYVHLKAALERYLKIEAAGGWPVVPAGPVLRPGDHDPRVAVLRSRLQATGDLERGDPTDPQLYDDAVKEAVTRFQERCGIETDGKVGPQTLRELAVPVAERIDQIRANLERDRWVFRDVPKDFLVVDIAGFRVHLFRHGREIWSTRVQVGRTQHQTPVFRDALKTIVLNPTWTVPPGILRHEMLPRIRKDPAYLARHHMVVVTRSGTIVDPATIDWPATARGGFPYMVRQEPGPWNALGQIKFLFPNPYMVYLHDTPDKAKFQRAQRAFSHGCIRTQNPLELAALLLADQGWDRQRIDRVLASRKTRSIRLEKPLPVFLLYWTAEAAEDGTVQFRRDLYGRDARIIAGLSKPLALQPVKGSLPGQG